MEVLKKVSKFAGRYMAIIVLIVAVLAFFVPESFLWVGKDYNVVTRLITVNNLLMVVMFGMGLTLKLDDFKVVFSRPKDVLVGCASQFIIMPLLAFLLTKIFQLSPELAMGVILVGTCPGRHLLQRDDLPGQGRCGPERGHDRLLHRAGALPHPGADLPVRP